MARPLADLKESLQRAHNVKRPLLTHLNTDTTWLLSFEYPAQTSAPPGRSRYNILVDPWLDGPQADVAGWFSTQWHSVKSSVQNLHDLNELLKDAEGYEPGQNASSEKKMSFIDAVVISHEFTDHCHRATLLQLDPSVPIFATQKAADLIRSWQHFTTVVNMVTFTEETDWRSTGIAPLPAWVGISRLVTKSDALYYHSAILLCAQEPQSPSETADVIIYTPHGVDFSAASVLKTASPTLNVLAFLHGLHDVSIKWSKQLNLGAVNAVKAQKILNAKYWLGTHDEQKPGSGFIFPLLRRKIYTVAEAAASLGPTSTRSNDSTDGIDSLNYVELGNGESLLLE